MESTRYLEYLQSAIFKSRPLPYLAFLVAATAFAPVSVYGDIAVLYNFSGSDGTGPFSLVQGPNNTLYGNASVRGAQAIIFSLSQPATVATVHTFTGADGLSAPQYSLSLGSDGKLYGTTGSTFSNSGSIFTITSNGTLTVLHTILPSEAGAATGPLAEGAFGVFFGVAGPAKQSNSYIDSGSVFQITASGSYSTLYRFSGASDGGGPTGPLAVGDDGNLYGTTGGGGTYGAGTIYKITPSGTLTTLYAFHGTTDGRGPTGLIKGTDGTFYGATQVSTSTNGPYGTIFQYSPSTGVVATLYQFPDRTAGTPSTGLLAAASDGNIYGGIPAVGTGSFNSNGILFKLSATGSFSKLHQFNGNDGTRPSGLVQGVDGNLYGTTLTGGTNGAGVIYDLQLPSPPFILEQPRSQIVTAGSDINISVTAGGTPPLSYQWYLGSAPVAGANWATLAINNAQRTINAGNYSVQVTNQYGSVRSSPASLTVISTPTTTPSPSPYPSPPSVSSQVDSLVFITHGETPNIGDGNWIDDMQKSIRSALQAQGLSNWQVLTWRWTDFSSINLGCINNKCLPDIIDCLLWAQTVGDEVGYNLVKSAPPGGWKHIHFIAHSAGSEVIQEAATVVSTSFPSTEIHLTFLDPYVGTTHKDLYGKASSSNWNWWSDDYFVVDLETDYLGLGWGLIWGNLSHAVNIDLTGADTRTSDGPVYFPCPPPAIHQNVPCELLNFIAAHGYPYWWYDPMNTSSSSAAGPYGYFLSKEAGGSGWANRSQYSTGAPYPLACCSFAESQGAVPSVLSSPLNYSSTPNATSTTGTVQANGSQFAYATGNGTASTARGLIGQKRVFKGQPKGTQSSSTGTPVWISVPVSTSANINYVQFDLTFTSSAGAAGLVTVYWNEQEIAVIDEQYTLPGTRTYLYQVSGADFDRNNCLSFRLDPFSNVTSSATVANVMTGYNGLTQPTSLSISAANGSQTLTLTGTQAYSFVIEGSTDLANWKVISAVSLTNSNIFQFSDPDAANLTQRFYRAVSP